MLLLQASTKADIARQFYHQQSTAFVCLWSIFKIVFTGGVALDQLTVFAGEHDRSNNNDEATTHRVIARLDHPNYNDVTLFNNDFSILTLATPIDLGPTSNARYVW